MSHSRSSEQQIRTQAERIAQHLKDVTSGKTTVADPQGRIAKARETGIFTFAIAMDDKILKLSMPFEKIQLLNKELLTQHIFDLMRGHNDTAH